MALILVYGDSQAHPLGAALAAVGVPVKVDAHPGASTAKLLTEAPDTAPFQVVYLTAGGNDSTVAPGKLVSLLTKLGTHKTVYLPPPPATVISDLGLARAVFGDKVKSAMYWLDSGLAAHREQMAATYAMAAAAAGAMVFDVRTLGVYPPQPDGVHLGKQTALAVARALASESSPVQSLLQGFLLGGTMLALIAWWRSRRGRARA